MGRFYAIILFAMPVLLIAGCVSKDSSEFVDTQYTITDIDVLEAKINEALAQLAGYKLVLMNPVQKTNYKLALEKNNEAKRNMTECREYLAKAESNPVAANVTTEYRIDANGNYYYLAATKLSDRTRKAQFERYKLDFHAATTAFAAADAAYAAGKRALDAIGASRGRQGIASNGSSGNGPQGTGGASSAGSGSGAGGGNSGSGSSMF